MQNQLHQAAERQTSFDDEVVDAFLGMGQPSLRARREVLYFYFKKVLAMNQDEVDRMHPLRVRAWSRIIFIELQLDRKKEKVLMSLLAKG